MIKELSIMAFDEFSKTHFLNNYYQTSSYALFMHEQGFEYKLIGYFENNTLICASLILIKKIARSYYYGYAPRGFLINYNDESLIHRFSESLKIYFKDSKIVFIRINPEIAIGELTQKNNFSPTYNQNVKIVEYLNNCNYIQIPPNYYFDSLQPRFSAIVKLSDFNIISVESGTRSKIKKAEKQGLHLECANRDQIETFYEFVKEINNCDVKYYRDYYSMFEKNNNVDLFLIKVNYADFIVRTQQRLQKAIEANGYYNELLATNNNEKNINKKMLSDQLINELNHDIVMATKELTIHKEEYIAGAFIIKYTNRIYFTRTGFSRKYSSLNPNHYMYYKIMEYYKNDYKFADLEGVTGRILEDNKYLGLNKFKLGFKPKIHEFIGEFDFVIDNETYKRISKKELFKEEFEK